MQASKPASIFDLVANVPLRGSREASALHSIFDFRQGNARCKVPHELSEKYGEAIRNRPSLDWLLDMIYPADSQCHVRCCTGMAQDNSQLVVSVTDRVLGHQVWYNSERSRKPQTFQAAPAELEDPTIGGQTCDFCAWQTMTAGRHCHRCCFACTHRAI